MHTYIQRILPRELGTSRVTLVCVSQPRTNSMRYIYTYIHSFIHTYSGSARTHSMRYIYTFIHTYMHTYIQRICCSNSVRVDVATRVATHVATLIAERTRYRSSDFSMRRPLNSCIYVYIKSLKSCIYKSLKSCLDKVTQLMYILYKSLNSCIDKGTQGTWRRWAPTSATRLVLSRTWSPQPARPSPAVARGWASTWSSPTSLRAMLSRRPSRRRMRVALQVKTEEPYQEQKSPAG